MAVNEDDIYQEHVLQHFEQPFHRGKCQHATHAHEDENPLCGDTLRIELSIDESGVICDGCFDGQGCCVSQAAASMLMERIHGRPIEEVKNISAEQMLQIFRANLTPSRRKCCLLCWRVLHSAIYSPLRETDQKSA